MATPLSVEEAAKALIKTIFRMCGESRKYQQDVSEVARRVQLDYTAVKKLISWLEQQGFVETFTFGQKVGLTDAGLVLAQRLIH
ncbi:MAG TPA: hypothetical protein V6D05_18555 [Stenomitos sp.]